MRTIEEKIKTINSAIDELRAIYWMRLARMPHGKYRNKYYRLVNGDLKKLIKEKKKLVDPPKRRKELKCFFTDEEVDMLRRTVKSN